MRAYNREFELVKERQLTRHLKEKYAKEGGKSILERENSIPKGSVAVQ